MNLNPYKLRGLLWAISLTTIFAIAMSHLATWFEPKPRKIEIENFSSDGSFDIKKWSVETFSPEELLSRSSNITMSVSDWRRYSSSHSNLNVENLSLKQRIAELERYQDSKIYGNILISNRWVDSGEKYGTVHYEWPDESTTVMRFIETTNAIYATREPTFFYP